MVKEIKDNRTTGEFFAGCELKLSLLGDALADARGIRVVDITSAVDDTGRNLLKSDSHSKRTPYSFERLRGGASQSQLTVELANPTRRATAIKELRGSIELFAPVKDAKSVVTIKNVFATEGKPIPALQARNVELRVLNKTQFEAMKKSQDAAKQANPSGNALGNVISDAFKQMFSGFTRMDDNDIAYVFEDPTQTIVDIELRDEAGTALDFGSRMSSGKSYVISYKQKPSNTSQLVVFLATPTSIIKVPLVLTDIALP